jgi:NAD(P)-dependent dehydrogenase (short-subunit alcohol dehydrogenase family)
VLLRWRLAVVVPGGAGTGLEVCLRLARSGSGVLTADPDLAAAEATAALARQRRVSAWALRVEPADDVDVGLLAARCRDLGGADILVTVGLAADRASYVGDALLPGAPVSPVPAGASPAATAVAVLDLLRAVEPGVVVAVGG